MTSFAFIRRILGYYRAWSLPVVFVAVCVVIETLFNAWLPLAFSQVIDKGLTPGNRAVLWQTLAILAAAMLLGTGAGFAADYAHAKLAARVLAQIRQQLFDHLQAMSYVFFSRYSAGDITARFSTDLAAVDHTLTTWLIWWWRPLVDIVGYTFVMFMIDWRLAVFAQLVWPMTLLGPRIFAPNARHAAMERKAREGEMLGAINESTASRDVVNAFGLSGTMSRRFAARLAALAHTTVRGAFFTAALERSASIGIYTLQLAILAAGGLMVLESQLTIGGLVAFYTLFVSLSSSIYYLAQYAGSLINGSAGMARIENLLAEKIDLPELPASPQLAPFSKTIEIRDFTFAAVHGNTILHKISLDITFGDVVAFVGASGSGKTAMLHGMLRFFDPTHGSISVDGHDLRTVARDSYLGQTAVVFQDAFFYGISVRENLLFANSTASVADIEDACRHAEIHDVIMNMPGGYDTIVGERGVILSGGQKQRLALARALLRNPRILFLDEVTSALDAVTESAIHETVAKVARGRTVVIITHHLTSVTQCDRIFVMDQGRLAEQGRHADLLEKGGIYANLWANEQAAYPAENAV